MARVTVEDCVTIIPNRFELVLLASQRARDISAGVPLTVERDNDKNAVVSLREVAEQTIDFEELRRHIVHGVNRHADLNFEDDSILALTEETMSEVASTDGADSDIQEIEFEEEVIEVKVEAAEATVEETAEEAETEETTEAIEASAEVTEEVSLDDAAAEALKALDAEIVAPKEEDIPA